MTYRITMCSSSECSMCQNILSIQYDVANWAWWHLPVTLRLLKYSQVDLLDSLAIQPSLLKEVQAKESLCLKK